MTTVRVVFADQLSTSLSALSDVQVNDCLLLCELTEEMTYVKHHPKKIAFQLAAMRHFAEELAHEGHSVRYVTLTDPQNTGTITGELQRAVDELRIQRVVVTEPSDYRVQLMVASWSSLFGIPVEIRVDDRFLCTKAEFALWAHGKKQLRMEYFYREMRKKYHILIEPDLTPTGGQWNYDKENRKPPVTGLTYPKRLQHRKSTQLHQVLELVAHQFSHHFGDLYPFDYAVSRKQALRELDEFIAHILPNFGDYQDAMVSGEPFLNHSLLAVYLNAGLLLPLEVCQQAEASYREGKAPLNAVEGFVRQIIGWREFVRGVYWLKMPEYGERNYLNARRNLPELYWGKPCKMACMSEVIRQTKHHAYSHHIQRLMVTGNFALLAGLAVKQVQEWYLAVYSDAYEWVEMPNTLGMALFGDGGIVGSKPYAASGNYLKKMSDFCKTCAYNPEEILGTKACPFNALYWDFFARNREKLKGNPRLNYVFSTWDKFTESKQEAIRSKAESLFIAIENGNL